jgi:hypothetical protein
MSNPTFMRVQRLTGDTVHYVDRRDVEATEFWNFFFEGYSVTSKATA